jgi:hypothetical protein
MLQAKECGFVTQQLSAISHSQAVAPTGPVTLLCKAFQGQVDFLPQIILQALEHNSGHEF